MGAGATRAAKWAAKGSGQTRHASPPAGDVAITFASRTGGTITGGVKRALKKRAEAMQEAALAKMKGHGARITYLRRRGMKMRALQGGERFWIRLLTATLPTGRNNHLRNPTVYESPVCMRCGHLGDGKHPGETFRHVRYECPGRCVDGECGPSVKMRDECEARMTATVVEALQEVGVARARAVTRASGGGRGPPDGAATPEELRPEGGCVTRTRGRTVVRYGERTERAGDTVRRSGGRRVTTRTGTYELLRRESR